MSIGKIVTSAEYRMDEQFQNLLSQNFLNRPPQNQRNLFIILIILFG